jgi:membrane protease YdiL (CAAX protease family)
VTISGEDDQWTATNWPPQFRGGLGPLIAFVLFFAIFTIAVNALQPYLFGPDTPLVIRRLENIPFLLILGAVTWLVIRYEGVRLREIGLSPRLFAPGVVAIGGLILGFNLVAVAYGILAGNEVSFGLGGSVSVIAATIVAQYLLVGPVEELAMRGYLQNRLVALLGGGESRLRMALGIVVMAVVFAVAHIPDLLLDRGWAVAELPPRLALLFSSAIVFGVIYELTRNLYLLGLLHGFGNVRLLFVDPGAAPDWLIIPVIVVLYVLLVWSYRRWASRTQRPTLGVPG